MKYTKVIFLDSSDLLRQFKNKDKIRPEYFNESAMNETDLDRADAVIFRDDKGEPFIVKDKYGEYYKGYKSITEYSNTNS